MYTRKELFEIEKRINQKKNLIQVITGPRQVGKTTIAKQITERISLQTSYVSADGIPTSSPEWISQLWETARIKMKNQNLNSSLLIIDEVQKIDRWSEAVKKEWDKDRFNELNLRVVLLGSSTLLIHSGLNESLLGRFEVIKLPHWSFSEMRSEFGFTHEEYVYFGGYPGAADLIGDANRWKDYIRNSIIETTISKDLLQLTNIQKPALLKNLFELACSYSGEILSYTKMLGQLHDAGNSTTLAHYQELLNQNWMIAGLQKFSGSTVKIRASQPKWIPFNTSLISAFDSSNLSEVVNDLSKWGRRVEQAIGAALLNYSRTNYADLFYWRDGNNEIDFILKKNQRVVAIEVKLGKIKIHSGLNRFKEIYPKAKSILISDSVIRWQDFLEMDYNNLF